jgi:hypothetical protein
MRTLLGLVLALVLGACGSAAPSVSPSADLGATAPAASGTPAVEVPSAANTSSMQPSPTPDGSTRVPNVFGWTSGQIVLLAGVADDVRPTCRLADVLPEGSDEGIRCFPDGVKAVGFYLVANTDWMQDMLYDKRLASYGVTRKSVGTCVDGVPGDILDSVTDGEEARIGCYVDENGLANARFTLPPGNGGAMPGVYIGVVGIDDDIATLFKVLEGRSWPGDDGCRFCAAPWGLQFEGEASGGLEPEPTP